MTHRVLQWDTGSCVYCPVSSLRPLSDSDPLPPSRRGLFPTGIQSRMVVLTHYYGPVEYLQVPWYCSACESIFFHNFTVPGPQLSAEIRMELAGRPANFHCFQTGLHGFGFGLDFLSYFESLLAHTAVSYESFLQSYANFWQKTPLEASLAHLVTCFARSHMLFALVDFLGHTGSLAANISCPLCCCPPFFRPNRNQLLRVPRLAIRTWASGHTSRRNYCLANSVAGWSGNGSGTATMATPVDRWLSPVLDLAARGCLPHPRLQPTNDVRWWVEALAEPRLRSPPATRAFAGSNTTASSHLCCTDSPRLPYLP